MASINRVTIMGNLGADPNLRYTTSGQAVCDLRVATNQRWKDKEGKQQQRTEWHRVVVWGKLGENCKEYLAKGRSVYVEGRLQTRPWLDSEGKKHFTTEIVATNVQFLSNGKLNEDEPTEREEQPPITENPPSEDPLSDVPF